MFKFLDRLLTSGHLEAVLEDPESTFAISLFNLIKKEIMGELLSSNLEGLNWKESITFFMKDGLECKNARKI